MSETTNIEWATSTGNPWIGCTKVSPGCKNCYAAELDANRFSKTMGGGTKEKPVSHWGKGAPRFKTKGFWKDAVRWNKEASMSRIEAENFGAVWEPPRIFPSLCDWLDQEVPIEWLADFLKLIHDTPNLDWLLLTKRPENFSKRLRECAINIPGYEGNTALYWWMRRPSEPPKNVWIGTSVEDQQRADERIPELLKIPAKVRFLSVEPLLGPVDLGLEADMEYVCSECRNQAQPTEIQHDDGLMLKCNECGAECPQDFYRSESVIDWVIVGGESGANRRDCGVSAIESVAAQCVSAGVPCFVKQDCAFKPGQQGRISDEVWKLKQFPETALQPAKSEGT